MHVALKFFIIVTGMETLCAADYQVKVSPIIQGECGKNFAEVRVVMSSLFPPSLPSSPTSACHGDSKVLIHHDAEGIQDDITQAHAYIQALVNQQRKLELALQHAQQQLQDSKEHMKAQSKNSVSKKSWFCCCAQSSIIKK